MYVDRVERASECAREKMNNRTHASERRGVCVCERCVDVCECRFPRWKQKGLARIGAEERREASCVVHWPRVALS